MDYGLHVKKAHNSIDFRFRAQVTCCSLAGYAIAMISENARILKTAPCLRRGHCLNKDPDQTGALLKMYCEMFAREPRELLLKRTQSEARGNADAIHQ